MKLKIYDAVDGVRWRLVSRNGKIVAESGEAYASRWGCAMAVRRVRHGIRRAKVER